MGNLAKLIKTTRLKTGYNVVQIALKVDIKPKIITEIEGGYRLPTPDYFADLCLALDIPFMQAWELLKEEKLELYASRLRREYNIYG